MKDVSIFPGKYEAAETLQTQVKRGSKSGRILTTKSQWPFMSWFMEVISDNYDELISLCF